MHERTGSNVEHRAIGCLAFLACCGFVFEQSTLMTICALVCAWSLYVIMSIARNFALWNNMYDLSKMDFQHIAPYSFSQSSPPPPQEQHQQH